MAPTTLLGGKWKYDRKDPLAAGFFGTVYKAQDVNTGDWAALKQVECPDGNKYVLGEIRALQHVRHENVIKFIESYEMGDRKHTFFIVTELADGSLGDLLKLRGKFDENSVLRAASQLAKGYQALHHANIIHRDLKPDNILYKVDRLGIVLKIADLGLAKIVEAVGDVYFNSYIAGSLVGDIDYVAPEVLEASQAGKSWQEYDGRVDMWAIGMIIYECCTGTHPHGPEEEFSNKALKLFHSCRALVRHLLQHDYHKRMKPRDFYHDPATNLQTGAIQLVVV